MISEQALREALAKAMQPAAWQWESPLDLWRADRVIGLLRTDNALLGQLASGCSQDRASESL